MIKNKCKNIIQVAILAIVGLLLMCSATWAATYYVDKDHPRASDYGPGTENQPWQHCPGMNTWTGSATLSAGDTVYFDSADTWTASGGGVDFLTVKGGVSYDGSTWGSGTRATFTASTGFTQGIFYVLDDDATHQTVIKGFEVDANDQSVYACINVNRGGTKSLTGATKRIEECIVHDVSPTAIGYAIMVCASRGNETHNVELVNCVVYNTPRTGINVYLGNDSPANQANNVIIRGCEIYNTGENPSAGGNGILLKNHSVNTIVEYNYIHNTAGAGIALSCNPSRGYRGPEDAKIRFNLLKDGDEDGIYIESTGDKSAEVYSNLIIQNNRYGIWLSSNLNDNLSLKVYNNTLYNNCQSNGSSEIMISSSSATFELFELKNNIIYSSSGKYPLYDYTGGRITSHSHNIYYRPGGGYHVRDGSNSYTSATIGSWESTALTSDPLLKNASNLPTGFTGTYEDSDIKPNADGLNITEDSQAKHSGISLGISYSGSINSLGRPQGAGWDLGAYEYVGATSSAPAAPTNLRRVSSE